MCVSVNKACFSYTIYVHTTVYCGIFLPFYKKLVLYPHPFSELEDLVKLEQEHQRTLSSFSPTCEREAKWCVMMRNFLSIDIILKPQHFQFTSQCVMIYHMNTGSP